MSAGPRYYVGVRKLQKSRDVFRDAEPACADEFQCMAPTASYENGAIRD